MIYIRVGYDPAARENLKKRTRIALPEPISTAEKDKLVEEFYTKRAKLEKRALSKAKRSRH
jgi:hypothetical protein